MKRRTKWVAVAAVSGALLMGASAAASAYRWDTADQQWADRQEKVNIIINRVVRSAEEGDMDSAMYLCRKGLDLVKDVPSADIPDDQLQDLFIETNDAARDLFRACLYGNDWEIALAASEYGRAIGAALDRAYEIND